MKGPMVSLLLSGISFSSALCCFVVDGNQVRVIMINLFDGLTFTQVLETFHNSDDSCPHIVVWHSDFFSRNVYCA